MSKNVMNGLAVLVISMLAGAGCSSSGQATVATPDSDKEAAKPMAPNDEPNFIFLVPTDKMCYSYGVEIARGLMRQGIEFSPDAISQGMKDVQNGNKLRMSDDELVMNVRAFQTQVRIKQARKKLTASQDNLKEGEAFLAENKTKEGVVSLPSGLQYKIIKAGNGPKPLQDDVVNCHYRGTLIDGTVFDSSAHSNNEGEPAQFKISDVIPGWREALPMMPVGSKWQLFIPPGLAYGQRGNGRDVGPFATLIYEVELIAIK